MQRLDPETIDYYDHEVVRMINEKYGIDPMTALERFVCSKTHEMLEDADYGLISFGAPAIFEIWEAENLTGNPGNSIYLRED